MKYKLINLLISISMMFTYVFKPITVHAENKVYSDEYEGVYYIGEQPYNHDDFKLEGDYWQYLYTGIDEPNLIELLPDDGQTGGTAYTLMNFELWDNSMLDVATGSFVTGSSVLLGDSSTNYYYIYMYVDTDYTQSTQLTYNYKFEFGSGVNPLTSISWVKVCNQEVSEYSITGEKLLEISGTTNVIDDAGTFTVLIKLSRRISGGLMVGSGTSLTLSDSKADAEKEENEKVLGKLASILDFITDILTAILELPSNIASSLSVMFDAVVNAVKGIGTAITNAIESMVKSLTNVIKQIEIWLDNLLKGIIDGLKSLFIPNDDYFSSYFDELYSFFSEKLGILMLPFDVMINLFNKYLNLENGSGIINIPSVEFMNVNIIPKTDYNLKQTITTVMGKYYDTYYLVVDVLIYFAIINMACKKFGEIVGGETS